LISRKVKFRAKTILIQNTWGWLVDWFIGPELFQRWSCSWLCLLGEDTAWKQRTHSFRGPTAPSWVSTFLLFVFLHTHHLCIICFS
jgi:hypothetical protein